MRLVACLRTDFDMEIQHTQLKIKHLSDTPSTKAAGGGIFSGVITQGRPGTTQGQEDFEISCYLFFQQFVSRVHLQKCGEVLHCYGSVTSRLIPPGVLLNGIYVGFWQRTSTNSYLGK